jgi:G:T-mismatch repair DNA endonuclease (very short patch repair protein)/Zn-dependent peptidase ImmA (M78 family)
MIKIKFNKEELRRKYIDERKHQWQLAKEYGCSVSVICTNLKYFGIKARPKSTKKFINIIKKEELSQKYNDGESIEELSHYFNVSKSSILSYLKHYNIQLRGQYCKYGYWFGKKRPEKTKQLKNQWKDPIFRAKALIAPRTIEAQAKNILSKQAFWKSEDGLKLKAKRTVDGLNYYESHKEQFIEYGKKGQAVCPRISSVEIKFCKFLKQLGIGFIHQYKYKLGIADICVGDNKIIELYGDYWHNYPEGREKDRRQIKYLKDTGYEVLIVWEHELKDIDKLKEKVINYINNYVAVSAY